MTRAFHDETSNQVDQEFIKAIPGIYQPAPRAPALPVQLEPISASKRLNMAQHQKSFEIGFPPLREKDPDVLIVTWAEIERQFLSLCAPWDQQGALYNIAKARQLSVLESPEKTLRWLMVLSHTRTNLDTPEPKWGTGESYPMP